MQYSPFPRLPALLAVVMLALAIAPDTGMARPQVPQSRSEIQFSFAPVVARATPAVVNIYATKVTAGSSSPFATDPFFSQFFGNARPRVERALGSGVILRSDGLVVSNYHVVGGATEIRVVLSDRREFPAKVVLADKTADLAVIKLQGASNLPVLPLADSDAIKVGDLVLAVGNPFGVGQTVTSGIVSGLARSGKVTPPGSGGTSGGQGQAGPGEGYFIQTDAAINPGNSGGALVDMAGRLVGINTSILSRSGGSQGIGFAIPANLVQAYLSAAEAGKTHVTRPWSGMSVQPVDASMAQAMGMPLPEGVAITAIHPKSPFASAGLAKGDVLLQLDGRAIEGSGELSYRMTEIGIGKRVPVTYWHDGGKHGASVTLASAPGGDVRPVTLSTRNAFDGLQVADITPARAMDMHLGPTASGVVVTGASGAARQLGLQPGDILDSLNGRRIASARGLQRAVAGGVGTWRLLFRRDGQELALHFRG